jgi:hypothetical protein
MANVIPQIPNKAKNAKAAAAAANSVPALRVAVEELCDAVTELQALVDKLIRRS